MLDQKSLGELTKVENDFFGLKESLTPAEEESKKLLNLIRGSLFSYTMYYYEVTRHVSELQMKESLNYPTIFRKSDDETTRTEKMSRHLEAMAYMILTPFLDEDPDFAFQTYLDGKYEILRKGKV